jgi:diguanylate cyclase (GGDEF)-like protein/PAS domain S-box-containing protein
MNLLDVKSILFSYAVSNAICATVILMLWLQNRRRFDGIGLWLADFVMQFIALVLVMFRGFVPDIVSMTVSNSLIIGGTILLYMGLERFVLKRSAPTYNFILLAVFIPSHAYFVLIHPSLEARTILLMTGVLLLCSQGAWLMLRRVDVETRPITHGVGMVLAGYCLVSVARIAVNLAIPAGNDFFEINSLDASLLMTDQMLFIVLTFNLFLMVNRRLVTDLEHDIGKRKQVEEALRLSEEKFFKSFHSSPDAILLTRLSDGKLVEVNEGFSQLSGYSREQALGDSAINLGLWSNPKDREECIAALRANQRIRDYEYDFRTRSGRILKCLYSGEIVQIGNEVHVLSIVRDITEHTQAVQALRESREDFQRYFNMGTVGMCVTSPEKGWIEVNDRLCQMLGYSKDELAALSWGDLTHPDDLDADLALFNQVLAGERDSYQLEKRFVRKDGETVFTTLFVACHRNHDGSVRYFLASLVDITERKQAEEIIHLRLRLNEFAAIHSLDALLQKALDEIGLITGSSIGFYHFVEPDQKTISLQAWSTRTLEEFCHAEGRGLHYDIDQAGVWVDCVHQRKPVIHNNYASLSHRKGLPEGHAEVIRELVVPTMRGGRVVAILGVGNKPSDYDEKDIEFVSYIADIVWGIVERKRAEQEIQLLQVELREQAIRDPLTGLYNRRYLSEFMKHELARATREGYSVSFVMIDIDHFKRINDTFGHEVGDAVLQRLAGLLLSQTRAVDVVCRYGGEEFLAILPKAPAQTAFQITERWRNSFLGSTLPLEHGKIKATISCGISEYPVHGNTSNELIVLADKAMYQAKNTGRNRIVVWEDHLNTKPEPPTAI